MAAVAVVGVWGGQRGAAAGEAAGSRQDARDLIIARAEARVTSHPHGASP